jgi:DNA primase
LLSIDGTEVRITNPDKPYFSEQAKLSKLDLVRYYLSVAAGVLVGIRDRPLVLKRLVNGAEGAAFYQNAHQRSGAHGCERQHSRSLRDVLRKRSLSITRPV